MDKTKIVVMSEGELEDLIERAVEKALSKRGSFTRKWLTQKEACEYVGVSRQTLRTREIEGKVTGYRDGQAVRYLIEDLDNMVRKG
ncbi:hypothetical protein JY98_15505 [Exiguobacterium mexicanum]|nr:hypothetical protein JY98_15505 [Exiguobacterium mexicanum]